MKKILSLLSIAALFASCAEETPKTLILYYSQSGTTQAVAEELQKQTGADIERFDITEPYEGDFNAVVQRSMADRTNGTTPTIVPLKSDLSKYDTIFLGYPVWNGTYATPVSALLSSVDLAGKKIVPFCTFGSGGLNTSRDALIAALPESEIAEGFGIRQARVQYAEEELNRFLIENGYKEGSIDPLPEFSEQDVVIPEELAIFEEATSSYMFPLGTPVSVGSRTVPGGVDFLYVVENDGPQGKTQSKIYVARRNGRNPEFTQVVR